MPGPARKRRVDGVQLLPGLGVAPPPGVCAERLPGEPSRMMLVVCFAAAAAAARRNEAKHRQPGLPGKIDGTRTIAYAAYSSFERSITRDTAYDDSSSR